MRKVTKRVIVRHIGEEFPLRISLIENRESKHSSSHKPTKNITYRFECTLDNINYSSESKNDALIAFGDLCHQLEGHGYKICCCGTCNHFYVDWIARHEFGGICGFCHKDLNWETVHTKNNVRHILHNCTNQDLQRDSEQEFILEE